MEEEASPHEEKRAVFREKTYLIRVEYSKELVAVYRKILVRASHGFVQLCVDANITKIVRRESETFGDIVERRPQTHHRVVGQVEKALHLRHEMNLSHALSHVG